MIRLRSLFTAAYIITGNLRYNVAANFVSSMNLKNGDGDMGIIHSATENFRIVFVINSTASDDVSQEFKNELRRYLM